MEAELQKIVRVYLKSTKGKEYLGRKEFQTLVSSQFSNMLTETDSKDAIDNMSKSLDSDQDGKVGFDEYMKLVGYLACSLSQQRALEAETSANNTASEPQSGAGNKAEVKAEVKAEQKDEAKSEATAEAKVNAEPKVDVKVEVKADGEAKPEVKPEAKPEVKVGAAAAATTATEVEKKEADVTAKVEPAAVEEEKPAPVEEGVEKKTNEAAS